MGQERIWLQRALDAAAELMEAGKALQERQQQKCETNKTGLP